MKVSEDPYDALQKQQITRQPAGCNWWLLCVCFPALWLGFGLWSSSGKPLGGFEGLLSLIRSWPQLMGTCGGMSQMKGLYKGSSFCRGIAGGSSVRHESIARFDNFRPWGIGFGGSITSLGRDLLSCARMRLVQPPRLAGGMSEGFSSFSIKEKSLEIIWRDL